MNCRDNGPVQRDACDHRERHLLTDPPKPGCGTGSEKGGQPLLALHSRINESYVSSFLPFIQCIRRLLDFDYNGNRIHSQIRTAFFVVLVFVAHSASAQPHVVSVCLAP